MRDLLRVIVWTWPIYIYVYIHTHIHVYIYTHTHTSNDQLTAGLCEELEKGIRNFGGEQRRANARLIGLRGISLQDRKTEGVWVSEICRSSTRLCWLDRRGDCWSSLIALCAKILRARYYPNGDCWILHSHPKYLQHGRPSCMGWSF